MGGVEAIIGGIHRHTVLDVISYYDKKYIEKWMLHDEAANLWALKSRYIFLKEHYTRLYGPRVAATRTGADSWGNEAGDTSGVYRARDQKLVPQQDENLGTHSVCFNVDSEEEIKWLQEAFAAHPFSKLSNRIVSDPDADFPKAMEDCVEHQTKRTSLLWEKAFSAHKRISMNQRKSQSPTKTTFEPVDEAEEDIADIIEVYKGVRIQSQSSVEISTEVKDDPKVLVEP